LKKLCVNAPVKKNPKKLKNLKKKEKKYKDSTTPERRIKVIPTQ
jgi:hypothetical protein